MKWRLPFASGTEAADGVKHDDGARSHNSRLYVCECRQARKIEASQRRLVEKREVQLAEQRSLFDAAGDAPVMQSVQWIERVMLGEVALGLCVIAVAFIGVIMLGGRLPVREGMRIVLGLFVVLGAPVIAGGFAEGFGEKIEMSPPRPIKVESGNGRPDLPPANDDPYAGASLQSE